MILVIKFLSTVIFLLTMVSLNVLFKLEKSSEFNEYVIKVCKDFLFIVCLVCLLLVLFTTNGQ